MNVSSDVVGRLRVLFGMEAEGEGGKGIYSTRRFPALSLLPETAVLEMTYRCNHECLFCSCPWYANMIPRGRELDTAEWKALIREYAENGVTTFAFTGGDRLHYLEIFHAVFAHCRHPLPVCSALRLSALASTRAVSLNTSRAPGTGCFLSSFRSSALSSLNLYT